MKKQAMKFLENLCLTVVGIGGGFGFGVLVALSGMKWVAIAMIIAAAVTWLSWKCR